MKKNIKLLVCLFLIVNKSYSQTILPASFSVDTFLCIDYSPYLVSNNVTINSGITVQFEKGSTILFDEGKAFNILGTLLLKGELYDSIYLIANTGANYWGPITTNNGTLLLNYTVFQKPKRIISANYGILKIDNSKIKAVIGSAGEDGIAIHDADTVFIANTILEGDLAGGKIDAIDADGIGYGNICNNIIVNWTDDGIDIGTNSHNVYINSNIICCVDCGISVGESSIAYAERNIIYDSYIGLQSHSGSILTTDHNTLFRNIYSFQPFHGTQSNSGGTIIVTNTILSRAINHDYYEQTNSHVSINYSLSDSYHLPGNQNIFGSPIFIDTTTYDFHLNSSSPCIDSGDPNYSGSYIGIRTDMGVYEYDPSTNIAYSINENDNIKVYPNPASNYLVIKNEKLKVENVKIINVTGKTIKEIKDLNSLVEIIIDISFLNEGVYFLKAGNKIKKFIKE